MLYATLQELLSHAISSDEHEEDAQDFLDDRRIPYGSHSRQSLITCAWQHGWRPDDARP
jgi:hypothetical protein